MALNGFLNSISCARTMALNISTPKGNGMVERPIKTNKHGLIILFTNLEHTHDGNKHLLKILFKYRCGIQVNTYAIDGKDLLVES